VLASIALIFCKSNKIKVQIPRDLERKLNYLASKSGIDLRRSIQQHGRYRIQLNLEHRSGLITALALMKVGWDAKRTVELIGDKRTFAICNIQFVNLIGEIGSVDLTY